MINRIVEIADTAARLKVENRCLHIRIPEREDISLPLEEVGLLLLSNPAVSLTLPVLAELAAHGAMVVVAGKQHTPAAMMLPLGLPATQAETFQAQARAAESMQKRAWRQLVQAKLAGQAAVLNALGKSDGFLKALLPRVRPGDPENVEARAARYYWRRLFGDPSFRRDPKGDAPNAHLNYGYAVLRAITARAVCASGLHPALGLHHHNRYDNYALASDLMEPFRPLVDRMVWRQVQNQPLNSMELTRENRHALVHIFAERIVVEGRALPFFQGVSRLTASLADLYLNRRNDLVLPDKLWEKAA
jgi:CRISPR-associated protein Cas1